jgi:hypothetical protein
VVWGEGVTGAGVVEVLRVLVTARGAMPAVVVAAVAVFELEVVITPAIGKVVTVAGAFTVREVDVAGIAGMVEVGSVAVSGSWAMTAAIIRKRACA